MCRFYFTHIELLITCTVAKTLLPFSMQNINKNTTKYEHSLERAYKCSGNKSLNPWAVDTRSKVVTCSWFLTTKAFLPCTWQRAFILKEREWARKRDLPFLVFKRRSTELQGSYCLMHYCSRIVKGEFRSCKDMFYR